MAELRNPVGRSASDYVSSNSFSSKAKLDALLASMSPDMRMAIKELAKEDYATQNRVLETFDPKARSVLEEILKQV